MERPVEFGENECAVLPMYGLMFSSWGTDTGRGLSIVAVLTYVYELKTSSRIFLMSKKERKRERELKNMFNSVVITRVQGGWRWKRG